MVIVTQKKKKNLNIWQHHSHPSLTRRVQMTRVYLHHLTLTTKKDLHPLGTLTTRVYLHPLATLTTRVYLHHLTMSTKVHLHPLSTLTTRVYLYPLGILTTRVYPHLLGTLTTRMYLHHLTMTTKVYLHPLTTKMYLQQLGTFHHHSQYQQDLLALQHWDQDTQPQITVQAYHTN